VFKARRKFDNNEFAVKISFKPFEKYAEKEKQDLKNEIKLMKELTHPFIVKIIDDFINSDGNLCIMQVLYPEGDFSKFLEKRQGNIFSENEILHFLANIIIFVNHLNSRDIYHRDLKPENFLI
jgi:serine/threonine protein kinase